MGLVEIGRDGVDWIHLVLNREIMDWWQALMNTVIHLWVSEQGKHTASFSRTPLYGIDHIFLFATTSIPTLGTTIHRVNSNFILLTSW
jgi:hypothetical protein